MVEIRFKPPQKKEQRVHSSPMMPSPFLKASLILDGTLLISKRIEQTQPESI
jgi:hypothetical protein